MKERGPVLAIAGIGMVILLATFVLQLSTMRKIKSIAVVPSGKEPGEATEMGPLVNLDEPVVVNLADPEPHYVRAQLVFELSAPFEEKGGKKKKKKEEGAEESEYEKEIKAREAVIRDAVIRIFRNKQYAELKDPLAQDLIKKEILKAVDKIVGENKIRAVYFRELVME